MLDISSDVWSWIVIADHDGLVGLDKTAGVRS